MKKIILIFLSLLLIVSFAGCSANSKRIEELKALGNEYLKNDKPEEHKKVDTTFVDAIAVYEELIKITNFKEDETKSLIEKLGRYIRRNIQIHFLNGEYEKSYELAKRMYKAEPTNMGNGNLYMDSAVNLANKAFEKEDYEKAFQYSQESVSVKYGRKALDIFGKSLLRVAEKKINEGDLEEAKRLLDMAPPLEGVEYNAEFNRLKAQLEEKK